MVPLAVEYSEREGRIVIGTLSWSIIPAHGEDVLGDPCAHMPHGTRTVQSRFRAHASIPVSSALMLDSPEPGPTGSPL